jgi:hypothetical protein
MSWSITFIGKPENIALALEEESTKLDGQSKLEYDSALPHLVALVKENFGNDKPIVKVAANGYGYAVGDEQKERYLAVSVERIYGTLV